MVDEAIEIWRKSWGWMLEIGAQTWFEVFDERWSQCHYWAGFSYVADDPAHPRSRLRTSRRPPCHPPCRPSREIATREGRVSFPTVGWADIAWRREGKTVIYRVGLPRTLVLLKDGAPFACQAGTTELRLSSNGSRLFHRKFKTSFEVSSKSLFRNKLRRGVAETETSKRGGVAISVEHRQVVRQLMLSST